jgi:DNA-binding CsgD family transcriptional regulator
MELDDVLAYAAELGVHQDDIELLTLLGSGVRGVEIANARGVAPRTIRNHRRYAIDAVIDALTDAHQ